jgi:hypothetical protein
MKLIHLDPRNKIATVECPCGGQTLISTFDASEQTPADGMVSGLRPHAPLPERPGEVTASRSAMPYLQTLANFPRRL